MSIFEATPERKVLLQCIHSAFGDGDGFITLNAHLIFPAPPRVIFQPHDLEKILYDIKKFMYFHVCNIWSMLDGGLLPAHAGLQTRGHDCEVCDIPF